jgi:tetratricopeptide (TPR) repeat protein
MTTDPMSLPEIDLPASTAPEPIPAPPPRQNFPARALQSLKSAWLILLLFQGSFLIAWGLLGSTSSTGPTHEDPPEHAERAARPAAPAGGQHGEDGEPLDARQGERLLREEYFAEALPYFLVPPDSEKASTDHQYFRVGLCQEGLGKWMEALASYRSAVARASKPRIAVAGQVAQGRVWARQDRAHEVKSLLFPVLLEDGGQEQYAAEAAVEAHYLLALAMNRDAVGEGTPRVGDQPLVQHGTTRWPIGHSLAWIASSNAHPQKKEPLPEQFALLPSVLDTKEDALVSGAATKISVAELIEKLGALAQVRVEWSPKAFQLVEGRTATVAIREVALFEVTLALTEPIGLLAVYKNDSMRLVVEQDLPPEEFKAYRAISARRALRSAVLQHPEHPLAAAACMELGNDAAARGQLPEALGWYDQLIRQSNSSLLRPGALLNQGLVQTALRNFATARKCFFQVIDHTPGHALVGRAWLRIGWTHLLEGNPEGAITPLQHAVSTTTGTNLQATAAVALAAAHLWRGAPHDASAVLQANRSAINRDTIRPAASFLDAFARYRQDGPRQQSRLEAAETASALLVFTNQNTLGPVGTLLAGHAYRELGLAERMAGLFEPALEQCNGLLADELTYHLADYWCDMPKRKAGIAKLQVLAGKPASKWTRAALLRLAGVTLEDRQPQACIDQCLALSRMEPTPQERGQLLSLLGQAYEALGDYQQAARCYGGELPK